MNLFILKRSAHNLRAVFLVLFEPSYSSLNKNDDCESSPSMVSSDAAEDSVSPKLCH